MSVGGALATGNSKLFEGPLGVVQVGYKGYNLGKTTADTNLTPDQDIKDIIFQQDGTKPSDNVRTGIEFLMTVTFGEINTGLLVAMMRTIGRSIYQSMRDTEAGVLKVASVDANGVASDSDDDILFFYEAIPIVEGDLINWGADTQRNFPVNFKIKYHVFSTGESSTKVGAFGYWGDPTVEDVPPVVWPDVEAPVLLSAEATDATTIEATFDENIALQGGSFPAGSVVANIDGVLVLATSASVSLKVMTLTFPASTFTSGDIITLTITSACVEDTESTANMYDGVSDFTVTNSL